MTLICCRNLNKNETKGQQTVCVVYQLYFVYIELYLDAISVALIQVMSAKFGIN